MNQFKGRYNHREEVIITRLILGRAGTQSTLYSRGKRPSNLCQSCNNVEDVEHIITNCRKYKSERETLRNTIHEIGQESSLKSTLSTGQDFRNIRRGSVGSISPVRLGNRV